MVASPLFLVLSSLAAHAFAQSSATTSAPAQATTPAGGYTLTPAEIAAYNSTIKGQWCTSQQATCIQLCEPGGPSQYPCDPITLDWACVCNNGTSPDIGEYQQSIPSFLCNAYVAQCVQDTTVAAVQSQCMAAPCGTKVAMNPLPPTSTATKSTATATTHSKKSTSSAGTAAAATSTAAAAAVHPGLDNGSGGIMKVGMLALLGLAL